MRTRHFTGRHHYEGEAFGPFGFLNPTTRRSPLPAWKPDAHSSASSENDPGKADGEQASKAKNGEIRAEDVQRKWRSRDNRKGTLQVPIKRALINCCTTIGRHAIVVTPEADKNAKYLTPPSTHTLKATIKGIWRMFSTYPYWDVSYLVAVVFTLGSLVWCINAFFVWLPLQDPSTEFNDEITSAGGITAFIGATIFEFGSILLMIEAVNENRADCFGWALEEVLEERGVMRLKPDGCVHHHRNKGNLVGKGKASEGEHLFMFNDPFLAKALLELPKMFRLANKNVEKREHSLRVLSSAKLISKNEFCMTGFANISQLQSKEF